MKFITSFGTLVVCYRSWSFTAVKLRLALIISKFQKKYCAFSSYYTLW